MQSDAAQASEVVMRTMEWAMEAHMHRAKEDGNRKRKGSMIPFFTHCVEVMKRVSYYGLHFKSKAHFVDRVQLGLQLGLSHDTLEDTEVSYDEIVDKWGRQLADLVKQTTRADGQESRLQKWEFLADFTRGWQDPLAVLVKVADRYVNVMDYFRGDPRYAAFYALQGMPLYHRFRQDVSDGQWDDELAYYVGQDIHQLYQIIKARYGYMDPYSMPLLEVKKMVTK